jgi:hypothetical protein
MVLLMIDFCQLVMTGTGAFSKSLIPFALVASLTAPRDLSLSRPTVYPTPPEKRANKGGWRAYHRVQDRRILFIV